MKHIPLFLSLIAGLQPALHAQAPDQPSIQVVQNLFFGGLLVSPTGGSITMTADGALIPDGSGVQPGAQPPCTEARFRLSGPPNTPFRIKVDPQAPMLTSPHGGSVRLAEFHCSFPDFTGSFDATGQSEVKLGGRLDIAANTIPAYFLASQVKLQLFVSGQRTATVPFTISAQLRAPLILSNLGPMDFGWLIPGTRGGTFELLPNGGHRESGSDGPTYFKGSLRPAQFWMQGQAGSCYTIQLPQQIQLSGPGAPMTVRGFTCSVPAHGTLPPGGLSFGVGGSLDVNPEQAPGHYRGLLVVTVAYP